MAAAVVPMSVVVAGAMAVRPVAIWGPAILNQVRGELSTGICTFNGQLRMITASYHPFPDYLHCVRDVLDAACSTHRPAR